MSAERCRAAGPQEQWMGHRGEPCIVLRERGLQRMEPRSRAAAGGLCDAGQRIVVHGHYAGAVVMAMVIA